MMSYSFRDKPRTRLSDRIRGKSGDELLQELRQEFDKDRKTFFDSNPNWGFTPAGSAFPRRHMFDDDVDDVLRSHGRGRTDLRAHLDDLARRHPEFAEHLRSPPGWVSDFHTSSSGGGGSSSGHFGGSYGGSAPDSGYFDKGERSNSSGNNQNQQQEPQQQQQHTQKPPSEEKQQQRPPSENNQESKVTGNYSSGPARSNRDNLAQHGLRNTDPEIGLKGQAAVKEDRNQRSMSAPPDGRSQGNSDRPQRFVSKIEINPVNPATGETAGGSSNTDNSGKPPMAPPKQQPQQQQHQGTPPQQKQSTVRHIPIFVEGRDEPVLPKNIDQEFTVPTSRPAQQFSSPHPQQQFHHQPQQFHPQQQQFHPQQQQQHHQQPQRKPSHHQQQHHQQQANRQQHQQPQNQESKENIHQQNQQPQQQQQQQPQQQPQPQAEKKQKFNNDPMYQIQLVQNEVDELRKRIDDFKGTSRTDKDYIYLDEMLTRNLIKLDIIETEGKENVRAARKETIRSIQQCINLLESKVPQTPITQTPSSTNLNEDSNNKMDVDEDKSKNAESHNISSDGKDVQGNTTAQPSSGDVDSKQKMEVDQQPVTEQNDKNSEGNKMIVEENQQQKVTSEVQPTQQITNADNQPPVNASPQDQKDKIKNSSNEANTNEIKC